MIRIQNLILLLFLALFQAQAHQKPWEQSVLILVDGNKPVECHLFCSLALLQEKFKWEFIKDEKVSKKDLEKLTGELQNNKSELLKITQNSASVPVFIKEVTIQTPNNKDEQSQTDFYAVNDLDASLVMLISLTDPVQKFTIDWKLFPDQILKKMPERGIPVNREDYEVTVTVTADELNIYKISSASPDFTWQKNGNNKQDFFSEKETVTAERFSHFQIMSTILLSGTFTLLMLWIFLPGTKIKTGILILWALLFTVPAIAVDWTVHQKKEVMALPADPLKLKSIVNTSLGKLYSAGSSSTPEMLYKRLESICREKFLDESFVQLYKVKVNFPDVQTIVENVSVTSIRKTGFNTVQCNWYINAFVRHSAHMHRKNLSFSGRLKFSTENSSWYISDARVIPQIREAVK